MIRKRIASLIIVIIICLILSSCQNVSDISSYEESLDTNTDMATQSTSKWVNTPMFRDFLCIDADEDGVNEYMILHDMVAMSGGHGGYELFIYEKSDVWGYSEIFNSNDYLDEHPDMDFQITAMREGRITFYHPPSGYTIEYCVEADTMPYLFNDDGSPQERVQINVDTFKTVEMVDVDDDGSDEIFMRQYASVGWHSNYIGDCESTWKLMDGELKLISVSLNLK